MLLSVVVSVVVSRVKVAWYKGFYDDVTKGNRIIKVVFFED